MQLDELETHVNTTLTQFMVSCRKFNAVRGVSTHFIIEDFGLLVCCIDRVDYTQASNDILEQFKDWRILYVTTNDNIGEVKYKILWDLMRGGYMKWLRNKLPRQVKSVINGPENLGSRIIEERLRVWGDKPKFKFLIEDNKAALRGNLLRELSNDPSFFDYMPEER